MKWVIGIGAAAVITGFVVGRLTVPNIVIGVDPRDFEAQASELQQIARRDQELTTKIDLFHEEFCRRFSTFSDHESILEFDGQSMRVRCPSRDAGDGIGVAMPMNAPPLVELID